RELVEPRFVDPDATAFHAREHARERKLDARIERREAVALEALGEKRLELGKASDLLAGPARERSGGEQLGLDGTRAPSDEVLERRWARPEKLRRQTLDAARSGGIEEIGCELGVKRGRRRLETRF